MVPNNTDPKVKRNEIITSKCDDRKWLVASVSYIGYKNGRYVGYEYEVLMVLDPPTFRPMGWYLTEDQLIRHFNIE